MKKNFLVVSFLLFVSKLLSAQTDGGGNNLDTNFAKFLLAKYPSCLVYHAANPNNVPPSPAGYTIDSTCSIIQNVDSLNISGLAIKSIEGIQYFKSLTYLNCSNNGIQGFPAFPNSVTYLDVSDNAALIDPFQSFVSLPPSLLYFDCSNYSSMGFGGAISFSLPGLPSTLLYLKCSNFGLYSLPTLPNNLIYLDCSSEVDLSLETLPRVLTSLPILPQSLTYLNCSNNSLSSLPTLPTSLTHLDCSGNWGYDVYNQPGNDQYPTLFCLPKLPGALTFLAIPNSITCLPNYVNGLQVRVDTLYDYTDSTHAVNNFPLCASNISCSSYPSDIILCPPVGNTSILSNDMGVSYQWQVSTDSIIFNNITNNDFYEGANTNTLQLNGIPSSWYGYEYRCIVGADTSSINTILFQNSWIGTVNSSWGNPSNWSCGTVPDSNTDVFINSGSVILSSNTSVRSLTVNPNASFTIAPPYRLTVTH